MTRVKRSVNARKKRRATLDRAKGYRGDALTDRVALGYASLSEPAIEEGIRRLARALAAMAG